VRFTALSIVLALTVQFASAQSLFHGRTENTLTDQSIPDSLDGKTSTDQFGVRPFITDDARVVGDHLAQLETWLRLDKEAGQH
jgi:hypothetical protein